MKNISHLIRPACLGTPVGGIDRMEVSGSRPAPKFFTRNLSAAK
jgi:hypothetical protein